MTTVANRGRVDATRDPNAPITATSRTPSAVASQLQGNSPSAAVLRVKPEVTATVPVPQVYEPATTWPSTIAPTNATALQPINGVTANMGYWALGIVAASLVIGKIIKNRRQ